MAETRTTVRVCGREYNIVSTDSKEHVLRVATLLEDKVKELKDKNLGLTDQELLTLVSLNLAEDYLKLSDELDNLKQDNDSLRDMARDIRIKQQVEQKQQSASDRVRELEEEISRLRSQNEGYGRTGESYR